LPATGITEEHDWWPLAERLASRLGEPLLAQGVARPTRSARQVAPRRKRGTPTPHDQLHLDLGRWGS
jgi:hypothetical protein